MVRPAKAELPEDLVGFGGELPVRVEQEFHARAQLLLAEEKLVHACFYVSHVDVIGAIRYKWVSNTDIIEQAS